MVYLTLLKLGGALRSLIPWWGASEAVLQLALPVSVTETCFGIGCQALGIQALRLSASIDQA